MKKRAIREENKQDRNEIEQVALSLSENERKILPLLLENKQLDEIKKSTGLLDEAVKRALEFLANKGIIELNIVKYSIVDLDENGVIYLKVGLPERKLANLVIEKGQVSREEASKELKDEFSIALGKLKELGIISLEQDKIRLLNKEAAIKKFPQEKFLEALPKRLDQLSNEEKLILEQLRKRRAIVKIAERAEFVYKLNPIAKKIAEISEKFGGTLIEKLTPEIIASEEWKGKKFRYYDIKSPLPKIYGGKRHFVNQAIDYARKVWLEMGFEEMTGSLVDLAFWNFDALFTPQDHPARELQDTFYIKDKIELDIPPKQLIMNVKKAHEKGIAGSKGWRYSWDESEAFKPILRTHTTILSAKTLAKIAPLVKSGKLKQGKWFAIGKCFRNETVDWGHLFEFNQTEGIVIDENANFRHLLGYLQEFFKRMGFEKLKFYPSYFPYTEPSVEIYGYHSGKRAWIEIGGAGIFRPEVVVPFFGRFIPVLAWGPGFDRALMEYYGITDIRELYENDINKLRQVKFWIR
ncbi:MAG: phenylalanine--tRNA ligase subunit alpha [Candidatus Pacearchaeota archaeon]